MTLHSTQISQSIMCTVRHNKKKQMYNLKVSSKIHALHITRIIIGLSFQIVFANVWDFVSFFFDSCSSGFGMERVEFSFEIKYFVCTCGLWTRDMLISLPACIHSNDDNQNNNLRSKYQMTNDILASFHLLHMWMSEYWMWNSTEGNVRCERPEFWMIIIICPHQNHG